jgi:hypothetical protein
MNIEQLLTHYGYSKLIFWKIYDIINI